MTMKESQAFEKKVRRIYDLLYGSGAEVKWNDHIPDPDNPKQARQIDVTVRRDGILTLVECRHHKSRQDVKWIEGLIGRMISLGARAVIAVSSSGFTAGAIAKARKHGICLRDLRQLSDSEITNWSRRISLTLYFYQYFDLRVTLLFDRDGFAKVVPEVARSELRTHPCMQSLFNAAAEKLGEANLLAAGKLDHPVRFGLKVQFAEFLLCGARVLEVDFSGEARLIAMPVAPPVVYGYGEPNEPSDDRDEAIQDFRSLGKTSIAHSRERIWTFLDLSELEVPPFHQFRYWKQDAGQVMDHEALELQFANEFQQLRVTGEGLKVTLRTTNEELK